MDHHIIPGPAGCSEPGGPDPADSHHGYRNAAGTNGFGAVSHSADSDEHGHGAG
ncbi:hypothetical protein D3C73_1572020 [compost metagenome]